MATLHDELLERVHDAAVRSAQVQARANVVVDASRYLRLRETRIPRCAWCGRVGLGGTWVASEQVPGFFLAELERRATHGVCPACFPSASGGTRTERLAVHAGGWQAAEVLGHELERYGVRRRADYVLEADVPPSDPGVVNRLLSRIADCLTAYRLDPVQVRLGERTYTLERR
jgi:hypothetical protein